MTLRPWACNASTTLASLSNRSTSYTSTSRSRSTGTSVNCHCQRKLSEGFHQVLWPPCDVRVSPEGDGDPKELRDPGAGVGNGGFTRLQATSTRAANADPYLAGDLTGVPTSGEVAHRSCSSIAPPESHAQAMASSLESGCSTIRSQRTAWDSRDHAVD